MIAAEDFDTARNFFEGWRKRRGKIFCSNFAPLGLEKRAFSRKFMITHSFDFI